MADAAPAQELPAVCKTADARLQDDFDRDIGRLGPEPRARQRDAESDGLRWRHIACVSNVSFDPKAIAA